MRIAMAGIVCAVFCADSLPGQSAIVEGRYWIANTVHRARIDAPQLDTEIDFKHDLGLADRNFGDFAATLRPGRTHRLKIGITSFSWEGDQEVARGIQFAGQVYTFGTRVASSIDLEDLRFSWSPQFIRLADDRLRIGPLLEGSVLWFDASLEAPQFAVRATDKRVVGYPTVGLAIDAQPHRRVGVFAEASGITAGDYGYTYSGEAGVRVEPVTHVSLTAGYRLFRVDPKFDPDYARIRVKGPFAGAGVTF